MVSYGWSRRVIYGVLFLLLSGLGLVAVSARNEQEPQNKPPAQSAQQPRESVQQETEPDMVQPKAPASEARKEKGLGKIFRFLKELVGVKEESLAAITQTRPAIAPGQMKRQQIKAKKKAKVNWQELVKAEQARPRPTGIKLFAPIEGHYSEPVVQGSVSAPAVPDKPNAPQAPTVASPSPALTFEGVPDEAVGGGTSGSYVLPPDTMGAVGLDTVFTQANNNFRIHNKETGAQLSFLSMNAFWSFVTTGSGTFDPRVQYDPYNHRWIVSAVVAAQSPDSAILVGVSETSNPLGDWFLFSFDADSTDVNWADYPTIGFNKNWVTVCVNMFTNATNSFVESRVLVLDYPQLRENLDQSTYFTGINFAFTIHPATTYSATEETLYMVSHHSSAGAQYLFYSITGTASAPTLNLPSVAKTRTGGGWSQPNAATLGLPQTCVNNVPVGTTCPGTLIRNDPGDSRISGNVIFRNGFLWYAQTVGLPAGAATHTAAQWTKINTLGDYVDGGRIEDPTATASNGGKWYAFPALSVNKNNDMLLGFTEAQSNDYMDAGYAMRFNADAAGTMRDPVIYKEGEDYYEKTFGGGQYRYGDYSHTVTDPADDTSFWTLQEYPKLRANPLVAGSLAKWGTWWGKVVPNLCTSQSGSNWNNAATWSCGHVPAATDNVVIANGHNVSLDVLPAANNITVNTGGTLTLTANRTLSGNLTVNGTLALNGFDLNTGGFTVTLNSIGLPPPCPTGTGDIVGTVLRTRMSAGTAYCFGNANTQINFTALGTIPDPVTVTLSKTSPPGVNNAVTRNYQITAIGGSDYSATVRLRYLDTELNGLTETDLRPWRYNGTAWESPDAGPGAWTITRDTTNNWVQAVGVTAFSPWAIGGPSAPTAVRMAEVVATALDGGVRLQWNTGFEADNLGFHVYREENGARQRITPSVIAGSALSVGEHAVLNAGRAYAWWDAKGSAQASYWIEDLDLNGTSTWHGPFAPQASLRLAEETDAAVAARPLLLEQVGQAFNEAAATHDLTPVANFKELSALSATTISRASLATSKAAAVRARSLAGERAIKIAVKQEGWYRIAQPQLIAAGLAANSDPRGLRLYADGLEVACHVTGADDGRFDATDAIEFYGLGLDTPATDTRVYWLIAERTNGLRIQKLPLMNTTAAGGSFAHTVERRDRLIYFSSLLNGDAENFFGAVVAPAAPLEQIVRAPGVDTSYQGTVTLEVALQGVTTVPHAVSVKLNGNALGYLNFNARERSVKRFSLPQQQLLEGNNTVTLLSTSGESDYSLVAHLRLTYQRVFKADNDVLTASVTANRQVTISGFTGNNLRAYDVTDANNVVELTTQVKKVDAGYSLTTTPQGLGTRRVLALNGDRALTVAGLKANTPSQWLKQGHNADLLIVTHSSLAAEFAPLAALRRAQGLRVEIVDIEDVYDEFNHGQKSVNALSAFFAYAAQAWAGKPRYVLLAGDASYDPRNYRGFGDSDLIPTRLLDVGTLETASDDALVDFNADNLPDLAIGRLPARNAAEARRMVERLVAYEKLTPLKETVLISDNNDVFNFEAAAESLRNLLPSGEQATLIARAKLGDTAARTAVLTALQRGPRVVNYAGHGSSDFWRGNLLTKTDALALGNGNQASVYVMMTCLNGYFLDPDGDGLSEALLKSAKGGAVAAWASSGFTAAHGQALMNRAVFPALFTPGKLLGDATRAAKAATADAEIRRTWILFGDPTMRLR